MSASIGAIGWAKRSRRIQDTISVAEPAGKLPQRERVFFNGLGGFTADGREYAISLEPGTETPAPWSNVIASPHIGTVVSERGGAYTWVGNAHEFRLTAWHNDPVSDATGEAFYIRDESTGSFWSPTPAPARGRSGYDCRHGFGYTVFEHAEAGIDSQLTIYVAMDAPVKFAVFKLRNLSKRARRISITGYFELGKALAGSRDRAERSTAVGILEKANEIKADQPEVLGALCKLYTEQGADSREQAIAACDKYVAVADSIDPAEKLKIGGLFAAVPDSGKALPLLRAAVEQDSTLAKDANFQIGTLLFTSRDWGAAAPYFRATLAYDSTFVPALLNLGLCQLQGGEKSGAIETFRRSLAIKPNDARTLIWVGQTLLTMEPDSLPVAFETYEAAMAADSSSADAQRGAGLALLLMDRCGDAVPYFIQSTTMDPDNVQGHVWLAQTYSKCKDLARAKEEFNKALELDPTNGPASQGLQIIRNFEAKQQARAAGAEGQ